MKNISIGLIGISLFFCGCGAQQTQIKTEAHKCPEIKSVPVVMQEAVENVYRLPEQQIKYWINPKAIDGTRFMGGHYEYEVVQPAAWASSVVIVSNEKQKEEDDE